MKQGRSSLFDNGSYKIVALVVALVLWVTMQGRRDKVLSREIEMQVLLPPQMAITNPIPQAVKLEISGPRVALKKFEERNEPYIVDMGSARPGRQLVRLTKDGLSLPLGAKLISIQPQEFLAVIVEVSNKEKGSANVKEQAH